MNTLCTDNVATHEFSVTQRTQQSLGEKYLHSSLGHTQRCYTIKGKFQFTNGHTVSVNTALCNAHKTIWPLNYLNWYQFSRLNVERVVYGQLERCTVYSRNLLRMSRLSDVNAWPTLIHRELKHFQEIKINDLNEILPATCSARPARPSISVQAPSFSPTGHRMMAQQPHYCSIVELQSHLPNFIGWISFKYLSLLTKSMSNLVQTNLSQHLIIHFRLITALFRLKIKPKTCVFALFFTFTQKSSLLRWPPNAHWTAQVKREGIRWCVFFFSVECLSIEEFYCFRLNCKRFPSAEP